MEDPRPVSDAGEQPVLYVSEGSLPCQVARLALCEKGVAHHTRSINVASLEQLESWYLKNSPAGAVPLLLHGGKTCVETDAVLRYVDKTFPGDSLATNSGAVDKFLKLVAAVPHDDYVASAFLKAGNPVAKAVLPQVAESALAKLKAHKEAATDAAVKKACDTEIAATEEKLKKYGEPEASFEAASKPLAALLDELDTALEAAKKEAKDAGAPVFITGSAFSLADCAVAPLLARVQWAQDGRDAVAARPAVAAYYDAARGRKAFGEADVWTGIKPLYGAAVLGSYAVDSCLALADIAGREWNDKVAPPLGTAWHAVADPVAAGAKSAGEWSNEHVIRPVADSTAVKAAQLAFDTQVMPRLREVATSTGDFLHEKVVTPCKEGSAKAGAALSEAAEKAKEAAIKAAEATKHAAEQAAEATKHAAEQAAEATKHAAEKAAEATKHAAEQAAEATKRAAEQAKSAADGMTSKKEEDKKEEDATATA